jgi:hypothetical protein
LGVDAMKIAKKLQTEKRGYPRSWDKVRQ